MCAPNGPSCLLMVDCMTAPPTNIPGREAGRLRRKASPRGELEAIPDAAERLCAMREAGDVQRGDVEVGAVVDQSPVSRAEEHAIGDINIGAAAVQERGPGLRVGGG